DVAALEWAWQECLVAEDDEALDPNVLQAVPSHGYPRLHFALRRAARLLESEFPIARIWEVNQLGDTVSEVIDLATGPQSMLGHGGTGGARMPRLSGGEFALLVSLEKAGPLEAALGGAAVREPHFDLAAALRRGFELGVFARMSF